MIFTYTKKLNEDFFIGKLQGSDDEWVYESDEEGDHRRLFTTPPPSVSKAVLVQMAVEFSLMREYQFEKGRRAGLQESRDQFQQMLGVDRLVSTLDLVAERLGDI